MPHRQEPGFFAGSRSPVAELVRGHDWSATAMGPIAQWPESLRSVVSLMLNSAFPMFVAWGPQLHIVYNDGYAQLMGGKHPAGLGQPFLELWQEIRNDLQPLVDRVLGGESFYMENLPLTMRRHGWDEETWFTFSYSPLYERGHLAGLYCACTETTAAVLAERHSRHESQRLAELFKQAPGFVAVLRGPDHVFGDFNDAYLQLVGFRELRGKPVASALPEVVAQGFVALLDQVYATGTPYRGDAVPVMLNRQPGAPATQVYVDFVFQPLRDAAGAVQGIFVQGYEVTEHRQAQEALRQADRNKDEFLATLAHELRNPLAPIQTAAQLLARGGDTPSIRQRAVDVIGRQVAHMSHLLDDLIDVARITQKRLRLKVEMAPLGAIVDQALEAARPLIDARRHRVEAHIPDAGLRLRVDPVRITQVLTNLLNNAAKYTDPGGHIVLSATVEGHVLRLTVSDDGIGISPAAQERLFRMFEQDVTALERSEGGLGVGLALVKGLVELHGGSVQATSAGPGQGSSFEIALPCVAAAAAAADAGVRDAAAPPPARLRILLADDNRDAASVLAEYLRLDGHEVITAGDGHAAVDLAMRHQPQVLVLDIGMPGLNGYEVARHLRSQQWPHRPFLVAATGWGQDDDRQQSTAAGFDLHLTKPFDPRLLASLLPRAEPAG
jgi:signal transduction histidine kinase/CheY-like chemotaxis protein